MANEFFSDCTVPQTLFSVVSTDMNILNSGTGHFLDSYKINKALITYVVCIVLDILLRQEHCNLCHTVAPTGSKDHHPPCWCISCRVKFVNCHCSFTMFVTVGYAVFVSVGDSANLH